MSVEAVLLSVVLCFAVLAAFGVLLTKDNFYAAIYMALMMTFIASCYAVFGIDAAFVLIAFVFVGAIGIVTVALAATYRRPPERQLSYVWVPPAALTAVVLGYSLWEAHLHFSSQVSFDIQNFLMIDRILLILFLISLVVLLVSAILRMYRRLP
ncbi:MAG: hypothetical protein N2V73_00090 [Candidatus Methanospirare jalkutatii]|nr:hypothetical protein [Candidatus Methanospirare jalkutatii]